MALAIWRSGIWERRVIREELTDEIGRAVTSEEYRAIVDDRMLRTRRVNWMHPKTSAALVNAQHELAFRKRRVKEEGGDPELDELVAGWRGDIRRLRSLGLTPGRQRSGSARTAIRPPSCGWVQDMAEDDQSERC